MEEVLNVGMQEFVIDRVEAGYVGICVCQNQSVPLETSLQVEKRLHTRNIKYFTKSLLPVPCTDMC